eukprot:Gb_19464 [translate_table: standard]
MKSAKMKSAPSDLVKQVWHVLRALAKVTPYVKADVTKVKDIVFDLLKKKKRYGGITIHYRSLLHLPQSFSKMKRGNNNSSPCTDCGGLATLTYDDSAYDRELVPYESMGSSGDDDNYPDTNSVSSLILQRIHEDRPVHNSSITPLEEIDQLADDFISYFHKKIELEKQQSYRRYEDMLARST